MRVLVSTPAETLYSSKVFAIRENTIYDVHQREWNPYLYLVLDETKKNLRWLTEYRFQGEQVDRQLIVVNPNRDDLWMDESVGRTQLPKGITLKMMDELLYRRRHPELVQYCLSFDALEESMTHFSIQTEEDVEQFYRITGGMHDAFVEQVKLKTNSIQLLVTGIWGCRLRITFEGDIACNAEFDYSNPFYWFSSTVLLTDGRVYLVSDDVNTIDEIGQKDYYSGQKMSYEVLPIENSSWSSTPPVSNSTTFKNGMLILQDKKIRIANVAFQQYGKTYVYLCPDEMIQEGDYVVVPVGLLNEVRTAKVVSIQEAYPKDITFPVESLKTVQKKYVPDRAEWEQLWLETFEKNGVCFDATHSILKGTDQVYDVIQTPFGKIWLEFVGYPVKMKITPSKYQNPERKVEGALTMIPYSIDKETEGELSIGTDFSMDKIRYIDIASNETAIGSIYQKGDYELGITCEIVRSQDGQLLDELCGLEQYTRLPEYYDAQDYSDSMFSQLAFHIAWKKWESDLDLAIDDHIC